MNAAARLRELLARPGPVVAPGVYDCISAKMVERAGFDAAFVSGAAVTASVLGYPDVGLQTMPEILGQVRNMARSVDIPLIVDIDTGYGNALNVMRTVREFEAAGAAALFFEDQTFPKRCGHFEGKKLIPPEEMVAKVRAACEARRSDDLVIIARTDARAVEGLDAALERARRYREAGADALFVEAPETEQEIEAVAAAFPGVPLVFNWVDGGKTPQLPLERIRELGFALVIYPVTALFAAAAAVAGVLESLGEHDVPPFDAFTDMIGLPEMRALEARFAT